MDNFKGNVQETQMKRFTFKQHLSELRIRMIKIFCFFICVVFISYYHSQSIYNFLVEPLEEIIKNNNIKVIYTDLTEVFFTYIKLSIFTALLITIPVIYYQIYAFIFPGLTRTEKRFFLLFLIFSWLLFIFASFVVFYFVMPKAWEFFLSFQTSDTIIPIVVEPKISEYINLVIQLIIGFGIAFQLPVFIAVLAFFNLITHKPLKKYRRIAVIINFILAAILTPPDVISQIILALPLLLLYEISIIACRYIEKNRAIK